MADQPAYITNLKTLSRRDPVTEDVEAIEKELYGTSDRTTVVMLGSSLDISLERLLLKSVIRSGLNSSDRNKIFEFNGPLGSFSSKIIMAYALNVVGPICRSDLELIRLLRNEFAHSRQSFGFDTPEVKAVCDQLKTPDLPGAYIPPFFLESAANLKEASDKTNPRTRFITACHNLAYRMFVARATEAELPSPQFTDNPLP